MSQSRQVKQIITDYCPYDFPMKVKDLIEDLQEELEATPDVDLMINIDADTEGAGYASLDFEIFYMRDETPQEKAAREKREAYFNDRQAQYERAQYERLKAKFG